MVFSFKLRADYCELARQYLDDFPAKTKGDFLAIRRALQAILDPKGNHAIAPKLKGRIQAIQELITNPEIYVEDSVKHAAFRRFIRFQVQQKIIQLKHMASREMTTYIRWQKERNAIVIQQQRRIENSAPPVPNSEAHTDNISEEEWLWREQMALLNEDNSALPPFVEGVAGFLIAVDRFNDIAPLTPQEEIARIQSYVHSVQFMLGAAQIIGQGLYRAAALINRIKSHLF